MEFLGFSSCKADPELWMRKSNRKNGKLYWEYILLYVDDCLCISKNPEDVIRNGIGKYFKLKEGSIGEPKMYLGNKISRVKLQNGIEAWSLSSARYVHEAVKNVEDHLRKINSKLPTRASAPFPTNCRPELDTSEELDSEGQTYYQSLIGVLRWIIELGRIDIGAEASIMASFLANPRVGHLEILYHIFAYLKGKHNAELVWDPSYVGFKDEEFIKQNWVNSPYGVRELSLPSDAPIPLGLIFRIIAYVDADHAGDLKTRRSRTGLVVFLNNSPIYWMSKRQMSVETSSYGSEFTALKQCCECVKGIRYKLQMMGIPCEFPCYLFGDNKSVLANSNVPHSVLKKKSCSVSYHYVREGVAHGNWMIEYVKSEDNISDILSKAVSGGMRQNKLVGMLLHHLE